MTLVRTMDAAKVLGVSRQAIDQAMARSASPPQHREIIGTSRLYDLDELQTWWENRVYTAVREHRMKAALQPTAQCNIRITADDYAFMDSLRQEGDTIGRVGRMLLTEAIEARKARDESARGGLDASTRTGLRLQQLYTGADYTG